ncbi:MAG TPA: phage major capsid protein [Thermomicrobiales bacterium]|jgi:HK97 family phage major capsid protein|nr:phage major capsid protein [Thermomicrobiales bacterium]
MGLTKVEAAKLTQDLMVRGVIDTIVRDSPLFQVLPFMDVVGSAVTYNREETNPAASFYDVGDTWSEATPTFTQVTAPLRIMGGDADIDRFLQQTYADPNDLEVEIIKKRAKAVAHLFGDAFYNGDSATNPKSFDGLTKVLSGTSQEMSLGPNGGALALDALDQMIDLIPGGRPDALLMSKRSRRKLSSLRRSSGNLLETTVDAFGRHVVMYDGIPVLADDNVSDTQTQGSATQCSSIYAVRFGMEGVMGLQNSELQVVDVGDLETKDSGRWRIKWYASAAVFSMLGVARVKGILP